MRCEWVYIVLKILDETRLRNSDGQREGKERVRVSNGGWDKREENDQVLSLAKVNAMRMRSYIYNRVNRQSWVGTWDFCILRQWWWWYKADVLTRSTTVRF